MQGQIRREGNSVSAAVSTRARTVAGVTIGLMATGLMSRVFAFEPSDMLVFSKGSMSIRPQLTTYTEYNDNIFFRNTNKLGDGILGVVPGFRFLIGEDLPQANHFSLQYRAEQTFHIDNPVLDALQHRFGADLFFKTHRVTLEGADRLEFLSSTLAGGYFSVNGLEVNRTVGVDRYRVNYQLGTRTSVYVQGDNNSIDYEKGIPLFDLRTLQGTTGFEWSFSEHTKFFGEAYYGYTDVQRNVPGAPPPGSMSMGAFVGARGQFTEKLSGVAKAGYDYYSFDKVGATGGGSGSAPVVEADVNYALTERLRLSLLYLRKQRVSPEIPGLSYTSDDVGLRLRGPLTATGKLGGEIATGAVFYQFSALPSAGLGPRNDTSLYASTALTWFFKPWFSTRLEYQFAHLESDASYIIPYNQNRVVWYLNLGY